jgi:hypothetical protein
MENTLFIYSKVRNIEIERFHICTWDFRDKSSLIEVGFEINHKKIDVEQTEIKIFITAPWLNSKSKIIDYFSKLKDLDNMKFIFNDVAEGTDIINGNAEKWGCIQRFKEGSSICLLPVEIKHKENIIELRLNIEEYNKLLNRENIYCRIGIERNNRESIALKKHGITKTTIIYDLKINERRNLPKDIEPLDLCGIKTAFFFNIIPNDYSISFYDNNVLVNIRNLEYIGFKNYLNDDRIKKDDLIVVFNKLKEKVGYTFFNVYNHEIIGVGALAVAILLNLLCGILLFLPSLRGDKTDHNIMNLPIEIYCAISLWILLFSYFAVKKFKPNLLSW